MSMAITISLPFTTEIIYIYINDYIPAVIYYHGIGIININDHDSSKGNNANVMHVFDFLDKYFNNRRSITCIIIGIIY